MREFPKSTTLSPHNKAVDFASMAVDARYEPVGVAPSMYQGYREATQEHNLDVMLSHLEFTAFEQRTNNWQMPGENVMLGSGPEDLFVDRAAMDQRAFDIREKLKYTAATLNPPHPPSKDFLDAIGLITVDNFAAYIKLYFRHWHKHAPMVHEATFNPTTAALPLVLALMSLGGMVSRVLLPKRNLLMIGPVFQRSRRCFKAQNALRYHRRVHFLDSRPERRV